MNQKSSVAAAPQLDMGRIPPLERVLIDRMAARFVRLAKSWHGMSHGAMRDGAPMDGQRFRDRFMELNPMVVAMDLCVVHLRRGLDLPAFYAATDLEFQTEMAWIVRHVDRGLCSFPHAVRLRFARTGEH